MFDFSEAIFDLIIGEYEPNDDECNWPSNKEDEELADDMKDKAKLEDKKTKKDEEKDAKRVPEFWLTILSTCCRRWCKIHITVTFSENFLVKILVNVCLRFS